MDVICIFLYPVGYLLSLLTYLIALTEIEYEESFGKCVHTDRYRIGASSSMLSISTLMLLLIPFTWLNCPFVIFGLIAARTAWRKMAGLVGAMEICNVQTDSPGWSYWNCTCCRFRSWYRHHNPRDCSRNTQLAIACLPTGIWATITHLYI